MFYHGTSSRAGIGHVLLPPSQTGRVSEKGRKVRLDQVFFTKDFGLACIYAGRAKNAMGGSPIVYRVIPMGEIRCLSNNKGASVFHADWAFVEELA